MEIENNFNDKALKKFECSYSSPSVTELHVPADKLDKVLKRIIPKLEKQGIKDREILVTLQENILVISVNINELRPTKNPLEEAYLLINGLFQNGTDTTDIRTYVVKTYYNCFQFYFELGDEFNNILLSLDINESVRLIKTLTLTSYNSESFSKIDLDIGESLCPSGVILEGSYIIEGSDVHKCISVDKDSIKKLPLKLERNLFSFVLLGVYLNDKKPLMIGD